VAVYTEVGLDEADALLRRLGLGALKALRGIEGGIENTNYFASTEGGEYVLTLFERLGPEQLPYYLYLMEHLASRGIPVPAPVADPSTASYARVSGAAAPCPLLHHVAGKPAAVVNRLGGHSVLAPGPAHCAELGRWLARMHLAGRDFPHQQLNLRGLAWWNETAPVVLPHLDASNAALLRAELAYQNHVAESSAYAALPRGPVHADLFRDNAMFDAGTPQGVDSPRLSGVFDFYFAGTDSWLFDLAVSLNDWAIDLATGRGDAPRTGALLAAYASVRPLTAAERELLPAMLRAAALRFWISRLWDFHLPREAAMLKAHDPTHFERVLRERVRAPLAAPEPALPARGSLASEPSGA
jgi:homoserine kinase type II